MRDGDTYRPVPVLLGSSVATPFGERFFKEPDVVPVPWEEKTGMVDLSIRPKEPNRWETRRLDAC